MAHYQRVMKIIKNKFGSYYIMLHICATKQTEHNKMTTEKYSKNLKISDNKVYSYDTHVATIEGNNLVQLGWWSVTTQKHINYVASQFNLTIKK